MAKRGRKAYHTQGQREDFSRKFRANARKALGAILQDPTDKNYWDAAQFVLRRTEVPELRAIQLDVNDVTDGVKNKASEMLFYARLKGLDPESDEYLAELEKLAGKGDSDE